MKRLILIGCLLAANHAFAESAAKVLYTQKQVTVSHNGGGARALTRGVSLDPGDQITTAAGAAANIQYSNGALVNIGSDSTYKILAYSPKTSDVQIKAELSNGKLEIQNNGKIKETLKTPIVSLAILGTHVKVYASLKGGAHKKKAECAGRRALETTNVQVLEGRVSARDKILKPGDSVRVSCDQIVNAPFPAEGVVASPLTSPGKINSIPVTAGIESIIGGAEVVTYIATNLVSGSSTSSADAAIAIVPISPPSNLAELSLICGP